MIKMITRNQQEIITQLINKMTIEEKATQVQCIQVSQMTEAEVKMAIQDTKVGSLFIGNVNVERAMEIKSWIDKYNNENPVILCADLVNGAGSRIDDGTVYPHQLGCVASDKAAEYMEKMGKNTAFEGRAYGIQWTFAPVVDLCLNINNAMMHVRTSGTNTQHVLKTSKAFAKGIQQDGYMAATAKHFPGDGVDGRDTHITTLVNDLGEEEWRSSYGTIWQEMINDGVYSVMSGHIALPFYDNDYGDVSEKYKGYRPACLSPKLLKELLRDDMGFEGCVVTDALNMIGLGSHIKRTDYGEKLLNAGNDVLLWTIPEIDTPAIVNAVLEGRLSEERLNDAVKKIMELKARVGLLDEFDSEIKMTQQVKEQFQEHAQEVADASPTLVRDELNIFPLQLKKGAKVLTITAEYNEGKRNGRDADDLTYVDNELIARGYDVTHKVNPSGVNDLLKTHDEYDMIFVNIKYPPRYGSIRLYGDSIELFKGSWWVDNPKVVFTSFGDHSKLYDLPSLHNYIMMYSNYPVSQKAAVKAWLGEIGFNGKSPVEVKGLINCDV